jgi:uncharacterized protein (DUF1501 family)
MKKGGIDRRLFLKRSIAGTLTASSLVSLLSLITSLKAADTDGEYKALVCILLDGGADVFNMVAPTDAKQYDKYKKSRNSLALDKETLLSFTHINQNNLNPNRYGMRSNMTHMHKLFNDKKMAIIANVGTLIKPVTYDEVNSGSDLPFELFAHNTQSKLWMMGDSTGRERNGWAARVGDTFYPTPNPYFNISIKDSNFMQSGGIADVITFSEPYVSPNTMRSYGFGPEAGDADLGNVYQDIYEEKQTSSHKLLKAFAKKRVEELEREERLQGLFDNVVDINHFDTGVHETGMPLGTQLELVAKILSIRDNFPTKPKRQIFFVRHYGWDTHNSDNEHHVGYLSQSVGTFYDTLQNLGIADKVTTFTMSEFGRTLTQNGSGSDHGWGSFAFVFGDAVKGGDIYGKMPTFDKDAKDFWLGSMIPTTSMESYLATLVKWLGATDSELNNIFKNLKNFNRKDLGFMS